MDLIIRIPYVISSFSYILIAIRIFVGLMFVMGYKYYKSREKPKNERKP